MNCEVINVPRSVKPTAGVLFLHHATGDGETFRSEANVLSERGVASVLITAPYARGRLGDRRRGLLSPRDEFELWLETGRELDLAVKALWDQTESVAMGLTIIGLNLGGSIAAHWALTAGKSLAGIIAVGAIPDLSRFWFESEHSIAKEARAGQDFSALRKSYQQSMANTDLCATVSRLAAPTLLQFGEQDEWLDEASRTCIHNLGERKGLQIQWQNDDHRMNSPQSQMGRLSFVHSLGGIGVTE